MKSFSKLLTFTTLVGTLALSQLAQSAIFEVNQFDDPVPMAAPNGCNMGGSCTLREAVLAANASNEPNEIHLPAGTYLLQQLGDDDTAQAGDLDLLNVDANTLKIIGEGADVTFIDAAAINDRIFNVPDLSQVGTLVNISIEGLTLTNGLSAGNVAAGGGMLFVPNTQRAVLRINACHFLNNTVNPNTGMINVVNGGGGLGAYSLVPDAPADVLIFDSTFSKNVATTDLDTKVVAGAGILLFNANAEITNTTISDNTVKGADFSGGAGLASVFGLNTVTSINNSTIANNNAQNSGGGGGFLIGEFPQSSGTMFLQNSIVADNIASQAPDCIAVAANVTLQSKGFNIIKNPESCNLVADPNNPDQIGIDPQLLPLANYGGPTLTHALPPGSPAVDHGNDQGCMDSFGSVLSNDQRGQNRPANGRCDVGAFELGISNLTLTKKASVTEAKVGDTINYTIDVTNEGPDINFNVVVTDELPDELDFVSVSPSEPTCKETQKIVTCTYSALQPGESKQIVIATKVNAVPANGSVVNTAKVNGTENDTQPGNDPEQSDGFGSSEVSVSADGGGILPVSLSGGGLISCSISNETAEASSFGAWACLSLAAFMLMLRRKHQA